MWTMSLSSMKMSMKLDLEKRIIKGNEDAFGLRRRRHRE